MPEFFEVGPIAVERGTKGYGTIPVTTMSSGYHVEIPVHIIAGAQPGPTVTLAPMLHAHEFTVIGVVRDILEQVNPNELVGNIVGLPVPNPVAFQMGTRASWFDGLWGPINDLNRAFPGDPRGWIVERLAHAIAEHIVPVSDVVIDFHGEATHRFGAAFYSYLFESAGELGEKVEALTYNLGFDIVVGGPEWGPHTLVGHCREQGKIGLAVEVCDFYGFEGEPRPEQPKRTAIEAGVTGVLNTMKKLKMIEGVSKLPQKQVVLEGPYVGVAPAHGGLLCPEVTVKDIGRVFSTEHRLATVISPFTFDVLDELKMPFEETIVLAVKDYLPFSQTEPGGGDIGYEVADWSKNRWIKN